jgi:predicted deacylase
VSSPIRILERPAGDWADLVGDTPIDFLANLGGPAAIRIAGRERAETRALVTLLHGNEPSGVVALRRWLADGAQPATDVLIVVAAVDAGLEPPGFANRMLPGRRDLNRCFGEPSDDVDGRLARAIHDLLTDAAPVALVDLHNNSGHNPPYGVLTRVDDARLHVLSLFANACMVSNLRLGTMVEALEAATTCVTVECGRSGDPAADDVAYEGICRYLGRRELPRGELPGIALFTDPIRVQIASGISVAFGDAPTSGVHLTLVPEIESFNFGSIEAGRRIGWVSAGPWPLAARGADGVDRSQELFELRGHELVARRPLVPVMMTTDARVAIADCLCYVVQRQDIAPG